MDIPSTRLTEEVDFWRSVAGPGWRWEPGEGDEFAGKLFPDPRLPVQLLFQRLDEAGGSTRAHLDLRTDDVEAEVSRRVALGARRGPTANRPD